MPVSSFYKFNSFSEAVFEKAHNLGSDTLKIALCAAANAPTSSNTVLANLTEISYTNCSSRTLTVSSSSQTSGTYKLVINDLVLSASGGTVGPFRYVAIYNDTASSDELIGYYDYGADITLGDGETITIDFDGSAGVFTMTPS